MDKLVDAVYQLVLDQHPGKVAALAAQIRNTTIDDALSLNGFFGTETANQALALAISHWQRLGCSSDELAGLFVGASYGYLTEKSQERVQLVWTGPDLNQIPVRRSEQVLLEIINSAQESLFIVSFVLVNIPTIEAAIRDALTRGVDVGMLLESEDKEGSSTFRETIERLHAEIPGLALYIWPRDKRESIQGGFARVHAKCAVADQANAFLTSANLTSAALDKNIEMGVHIQGGNIPQTIYQQFIGMIKAKEITPYAANCYQIQHPAKSAATPLAQLGDNLEFGAEILLSFQNSKLGVEQQRRFKVLSTSDERPEAHSVVLVRHDNQWLVGKYAWSRQQDTEGGRVFYLVSVRGFGPTQKFEVDESDWEDFMPRAVEKNTKESGIGKINPKG